jgi:hypothetical protein
MTPEQAKELQKGDQVIWKGRQCTVESVGRFGNNIRLWRPGQIPGSYYSEFIPSDEVERV